MPDTGAPYFIPYVEPTDLVRDYPAANEAMALAIVAALEDIPVTIKKVDGFTGSGTFVVPAGVTHAIAHCLGGGGGIGSSQTGGDGGDSSVAFASATVIGRGGIKGIGAPDGISIRVDATKNNSGLGAQTTQIRALNGGAYVVGGAAVTPAESITVTVGAGGAAGTLQSAQAGSSGYVYIEYFEEA